MLQHALWAILIAACIVLGIWEISRWRDQSLAAVITQSHKWRRAVGLALLVSVAVMGYQQAGFPHHASKIESARELVYLMTMMLMVVALVGVAYYEWKATLVEFAGRRKEAIGETIADLPIVPSAQDLPSE